jgi:hypothetical protein
VQYPWPVRLTAAILRPVIFSHFWDRVYSLAAAFGLAALVAAVFTWWLGALIFIPAWYGGFIFFRIATLVFGLKTGAPNENLMLTTVKVSAGGLVILVVWFIVDELYRQGYRPPSLGEILTNGWCWFGLVVIGLGILLGITRQD